MTATPSIIIFAIALGSSIGLNIALGIELWKMKRMQRGHLSNRQTFYRE